MDTCIKKMSGAVSISDGNIKGSGFIECKFTKGIAQNTKSVLIEAEMCEIHVTNDSAVYNVEFICNSNITGSLSFDVVKTLDKTKIIVKNPNCIEGIRMNVNIPKEVTELYVKSVSGPVNVKHTAYDNMNVEFNVRNANAKMELNNFASVRLASITMNGGNIHSRYVGTRMAPYICQLKADVTAGDIIIVS